MESFCDGYVAAVKPFRLGKGGCLSLTRDEPVAYDRGMSPHQCIEAIRAKMLRVSLAELADASGISKRQLERIRGNYQSPTVETLQAVYDGLRLVKPKRLDKRGEK